MSERDSIQKQIMIHASAARVWELVSVPGWWIANFYNGQDDQIRERRGDLDTVIDPQYGTFSFRTLNVVPGREITFQWVPVSGDNDGADSDGTNVRFVLEEDGEAVKVTVIESGFSALYPVADDRDKAIKDNESGWDYELGLLKAMAEA